MDSKEMKNSTGKQEEEITITITTRTTRTDEIRALTRNEAKKSRQQGSLEAFKDKTFREMIQNQLSTTPILIPACISKVNQNQINEKKKLRKQLRHKRQQEIEKDPITQILLYSINFKRQKERKRIIPGALGYRCKLEFVACIIYQNSRTFRETIDRFVDNLKILAIRSSKSYNMK